MGKLLALELFNFKSYKGHHVLQFGDSYFTSIIGPNGSGKSNSMDAISFVLGVKSAHLRSTHLRDLVYRGRVLKTAKIGANGDAVENGQTNGHANGDAGAGASDDEETDTQTSTRRNDPQTAWVMAIYEDDAGEEQRWKRSISAAGQSEYRINNRAVTAKQYNESLEAENILVKARNFLVFQGDVEALASQSPKDLTRLIELVSGSLEYKADYERLQAEKDKAEEDQGHKLHQRRGINGEIRAFQQQKEELERFESLNEERDHAVVTGVLWKLFHFQQTIKASSAEIQKHQNELKEYRRNVKKYEDSLEAAKREQAKVQRDVTKSEREIASREKALQDKENALVPIDQKLLDGNKKLEGLQSLIRELGRTRDARQKDSDRYQKDLGMVQKAQQRTQEKRKDEQHEAGVELTDEDLREYENLRGVVYKGSGQDQAERNKISRNLRTDEETVKSLESSLETSKAQVSALEEEIATLSESRSRCRGKAKETKQQIDQKQKEINTLKSSRVRAEAARKELEEKHFTYLTKIGEAKRLQRDSEKEARLRETVSTLRNAYPGVKGLVHNLCNPSSGKYAVAVQMALGRHWDSLVCDTNKTAQDCIDYLKLQKLGVLTMLPLDTVTQQHNKANLRDISGKTSKVRLAIDAITFNKDYERVMNMVLGDAVVTDTVDVAKEICYNRNVQCRGIALDGTVISKGGNITGGAAPDTKKRRFRDDELEEWSIQEAKIRTDLEALPRSDRSIVEEDQLQNELSRLTQTLNLIQEEVKALDRNIESKNQGLAHYRRDLQQLQPKYQEQARGVETLRASLHEFTMRIEEIEDEVFAEFCSRLGYEDIREYDRQRGAQHEEAKREEVRFKEQISRLQNQVAAANSTLKVSNDHIARVQVQMERQSEIVAQLEAEKESINDEIDQLNAEIETLNEELTTLREHLQERGEKVNEARREVSKRMKSVEKMLKEVANFEAEIEKASSARHGVLKSCKIENINLPLEKSSRKLASLPLEDAILEQEDDENAMDVDDETRTVKVNDFGIAVDFSELDDDLKEDNSDVRETALAEAVAFLQAELDKMAPNMRSAERLEQTSERLKATDREFNESRSAAKQAIREFETVKKKRLDLFNKAFFHISDQIDAVYKELTRTVSFPQGGRASLDAEDDDEPYLHGIKYVAQPALKKYREMEHLSGGEKTMAALALLFAVHTYAPSPFFVLDEVDAALDNANTSQLARYVREHAGPGMQFVVISLKPGLFQNSETLVGVMRDQAVNSSRPLTLDLRKYQAV